MLTYCPIEATRPTRTHTIAVKTFDGCVLGEKKRKISSNTLISIINIIIIVYVVV